MFPHFLKRGQVGRNALSRSIDTHAPTVGNCFGHGAVGASYRFLQFGHDVDNTAMPDQKLPYRILKPIA